MGIYQSWGLCWTCTKTWSSALWSMDEGSRRRVGLRSNCAAPRVQAGCILVTRFLSDTDFSFFVSENGKQVFKRFCSRYRIWAQSGYMGSNMNTWASGGCSPKSSTARVRGRLSLHFFQFAHFILAPAKEAAPTSILFLHGPQVQKPSIFVKTTLS